MKRQIDRYDSRNKRLNEKGFQREGRDRNLPSLRSLSDDAESDLKINKIHNIDCLDGLKQMSDESIDLIVTSPPYFNAREYSQWETVEDYMNDMRNIFIETYRTVKNHHYVIVNVGDISCQVGKAKWMKWFFYIYYPLHLLIIGILRITLYGNIPILFN